jgi:hypothetical protein
MHARSCHHLAGTCVTCTADSIAAAAAAVLPLLLRATGACAAQPRRDPGQSAGARGPAHCQQVSFLSCSRPQTSSTADVLQTGLFSAWHQVFHHFKRPQVAMYGVFADLAHTAVCLRPHWYCATYFMYTVISAAAVMHSTRKQGDRQVCWR